MYMYVTYILYYIDSVFVYISIFPKKLYIFICLCVPVLHPLVSTWRAPFSISYKARLKVKVAQSCLTLGNAMDCRVHGIPQARKRVGSHSLLHVFSPTQVSHIAGRFFTSCATREAQEYWSGQPVPSPEDIPSAGIKPGSPALQEDSLPAELPGKPVKQV